MKLLLIPITTFMISLCTFAQIPQNGLVQIFDNLDIPAGVVVGNVTISEDRNGSFCALEFDGELTSLILVQGWEQYIIDPDSSMSISLWYQGGSDEAGDLESLFIKYGTGLDPHANPIYGLQLYDLNTPLMSSPGYSVWADQSAIVFPDDPDWHHLVGVFEVGTWRLYLDNVLSGANLVGIPTVGEGNNDIAIGPGFQGKLDDILFYNRALNSEEVEGIFNSATICAVGFPDITNELDISVFPNPSTDILTIDLKENKVDHIRIIDVQGRIVAEQLVFLKKFQVQTSNLLDATYIIEFSSKGERLGYVRFTKGC